MFSCVNVGLKHPWLEIDSWRGKQRNCRFRTCQVTEVTWCQPGIQLSHLNNCLLEYLRGPLVQCCNVESPFLLRVYSFGNLGNYLNRKASSARPSVLKSYTLTPGVNLTWSVHVNPNPYEISSLNINTIYLYLETSLYVKFRLLYWYSVNFQLTGADLTF